jgi:uncharacterized protein (TIGR02391 family)
MPFPLLSKIQVEAISRVLGEANSGSEITKLLSMVGINDNNTQLTKWRRIDNSLNYVQDRTKNSNHLYELVRVAMDPVRFTKEPEKFNTVKEELNSILLMVGLEINNNGRIVETKRAESLSQALERTNRLRKKLYERNIHQEILRFCIPEYLQKNYFHAVLEATKSVLERLRNLTGIKEDGIKLVLQVFDEKKPKIAFNSYETDSEKNELMGFRSIIIGLVKMVRNPTAHEAKIKWSIDEKEALDIFSMLSFIHRKLDESFKTYY